MLGQVNPHDRRSSFIIFLSWHSEWYLLLNCWLISISLTILLWLWARYTLWDRLFLWFHCYWFSVIYRLLLVLRDPDGFYWTRVFSFHSNDRSRDLFLRTIFSFCFDDRHSFFLYRFFSFWLHNRQSLLLRWFFFVFLQNRIAFIFYLFGDLGRRV